MTANYKVSRAKSHQQITDGVVLSIKQPSEGYSRGSKYMHYGLERDDAVKLAEEILDALER